jgi:hypothetical protein
MDAEVELMVNPIHAIFGGTFLDLEQLVEVEPVRMTAEAEYSEVATTCLETKEGCALR